MTEEVELLDGEVIEVAAFRFRQRKNRNRTGGKEMFVVVAPMLEEILKPLDRTTPTVLVNGYGQPFSEKSPTGMMAHWTKQASLEPGYTRHGLRKSLGNNLAESGATTREIMACLGHDHIGQAELYSRDAEQRRLVVQAMQKLTAVERRRRLRFAGSKK